MTDKKSTVALVGTGRMGAAMARRFHGAGHELILWNRDRSKAEKVAGETGGRVASSASEAASQAEIVVSSLADDHALESVYLGHDGVVDGISPAQSLSIPAPSIQIAP